SVKKMSAKQKAALIEQLTEEMKFAAGALEFERAAQIRDKIKAIQTTK
ncbi:MAG: UvrB/UvrC motif-containing protein, partial [Clostridia bacterium]|nr:UvrB/UvrC motif-containing protein [Clostridia bacterium]